MKRIVLLGGLVGILALGVAVALPVVSPAMAQEDYEEDDRRGDERTLLDNIKSAGWVGVIEILISVVGVALIIDYMVNIRRDKLAPPYVLSELENLFDDEAYDAAMDLCDAEDTYLTRVVGGGLSKIGAGFDRMMEAALTTGDEETLALNQKLSYLSLIASIEPMLGLLGTVLGMIRAFNTIATLGGTATPSDLADGISQALITTAIGLIVAIPMTCVYLFFRNRVLRIVQEVTAITGELFDRFRPSA